MEICWFVVWKNHSTLHHWREPSMRGRSRLSVLEAAGLSRWWRVTAGWIVIMPGAQHMLFPALCFVPCCEDSLSVLMSKAQKLAPPAQEAGEAKPCSYPAQDPGEKGSKGCWTRPYLLKYRLLGRCLVESSAVLPVYTWLCQNPVVWSSMCTWMATVCCLVTKVSISRLRWDFVLMRYS